MATEANIIEAHNWFTGASKRFVFTVDIDNIGGDLEWTLRSKATEETFLLQKTVGDGITITQASGPPCIVELDIADTDTADLEPGTYDHALKDRSNKQVLSFGTAVLQQVATR